MHDGIIRSEGAIRRRATALLEGDDWRVAWICAPAGSGKTVLASSFTGSSGAVVIWMRMEAALADTGRFLAALHAAAQAAFPARYLPALASEDVVFAAAWLRRLFAALPRSPDTLLVIDDFHRLGDNAAPSLLLAEAMREAPPGLRVMLLTRAEPEPAWAWFAANGEDAVVTFADLALDRSEAAGLVDMTSSAEWTADDLLVASGGWILGARLILRSRAGTAAGPLSSSFDLSDLIGHELLAPLDEGQASLLAELVQCGNLPVDVLVEALEGRLSPQDLRSLAGHFVFVQLDPAGRLQIHDLLKDAVRKRFRHLLDDAAVLALRTRAADALIRSGAVREGLALLSAAGAWEALADAVATHAPALAEAGDFGILLALLSPVPDEIRVEDLALGYWHGAALLNLDPRRARELLSRTYAKALSEDAQDYLIPLWTAMVDAIWFEWIDCTLFDPLIEALPRMQALAAERARPHENAMLARGAFGALSFRRPEAADFPDWERRNADFFWQEMPRHETIRRGIQLMFRYCWGEGERWKGAQVRERLNYLFDETTAPLADICTRHVVSTEYLSIFEPDAEIVFETLRNGLEQTARHQQSFWDVTMINAALYRAMSLEDLPRCDHMLALLAARLGEFAHPNHVAIHEHFIAYRHWIGGNPEAAMTHAATAYRACVASGFAIFPLHYGCALAAIQHALGRRREALREAARVRRLAQAQRSPLLYYNACLRSAAIALDAGRSAFATSFLRSALQAAAPMRYYLHQWIRRHEMAELLDLATEAGVEPDYVSDLKAVLGFQDKGATTTVELVTLGRFDIRAAGRSLLVSVKQQRAPMALALHLVAAGPQGERGERLADMIWPDAGERASRNRLKSTLYRLRRLIGVHEAVTTRAGRIALDPELVVVDAWEFERQASAAPRQALERYGGALVQPGGESESCLIYGQRLERLAADVCARLAGASLSDGDGEAALEVASLGLERVGFDEDLLAIASEAARRVGDRDAEARLRRLEREYG